MVSMDNPSHKPLKKRPLALVDHNAAANGEFHNHDEFSIPNF